MASLATRRHLSATIVAGAVTLLPALGAPAGRGAPVPAAPAAASPAARLEVSPPHPLAGDPVSIKVTGLRPGVLVTVHAQSTERGDSGVRQPFYGEATFLADAAGTIDLATAAPVTGSYQDADVRGLFWSERAGAGQETIARLHLDDPASIGAGQVVLTLEKDGSVKDRQVVTFLPSDPGMVREEVREGGLVGAFYYEKATRRRPVVVALGGSEGGLDVADWIGPKLAARGFAVFGLAYVSPPGQAIEGVPKALARIPVESIEKVRSWLAARPEADIRHMGIVGYSKGSEFALVLAALYDWIDAVVAYAPSDVVWQGIQYGGGGGASSSWSRAGKDLPFLPSTGTREEIARGRQSGGAIFLARVAKANLAAASPDALAAAAIQV